MTSRAVRPRSRAARVCRTSAPTATSSPASGSSSRITFGSVARARAIATRWAWPPDNWTGLRSTKAPQPTASSSVRARARAAAREAPPASGPNITLASTSRCGNSEGRWVSRATRRRWIGTWTDPPATVASSMRTVPALGATSPATRCNKVVLPEPFGPTTAVTVPGGTSMASSTPRVATAAWTPTAVRAPSGTAILGAIMPRPGRRGPTAPSLPRAERPEPSAPRRGRSRCRCPAHAAGRSPGAASEWCPAGSPRK